MSEPGEHLANVEGLEPPNASHASTIMNGAGNGIMLGTLPFLGLELFAEITGKSKPKNAGKLSAFALVTGCLLGTIYGVCEAKQVKHYRETVSEEIASLRTQVNRQQTQLDSWQARHETGLNVPASPSTR